MNLPKQYTITLSEERLGLLIEAVDDEILLCDSAIKNMDPDLEKDDIKDVERTRTAWIQLGVFLIEERDSQ